MIIYFAAKNKKGPSESRRTTRGTGPRSSTGPTTSTIPSPRPVKNIKNTTKPAFFNTKIAKLRKPAILLEFFYFTIYEICPSRPIKSRHFLMIIIFAADNPQAIELEPGYQQRLLARAGGGLSRASDPTGVLGQAGVVGHRGACSSSSSSHGEAPPPPHFCTDAGACWEAEAEAGAGQRHAPSCFYGRHRRPASGTHAQMDFYG